MKSTFLTKSEFIVFKDGEQITKNIDFPNIKNQKIMSIGFFKDFTGLASTVMLSTDVVQNIQIINEIRSFNFGLYNEKHIRMFKNIIENPNHHINLNPKLHSEFKHFIDNMLFIYSPVRFTNNKVKDLLENIDAEINTTIENNKLVGGIANNFNYQMDISFLGGFNLLLPIFDFFSNNNFINSVVVSESLNLIYKILANGEHNIVNFFKLI